MNAAPQPARLVETALRCYPARWRRRHGEEAAELAALLIRDGTPAGSIAWNYLAGAAREWLAPPPGRRLGIVACALLAVACSMGISAGLLTPAVPARASTSQPPHGHAHCRAGSRAPVPGVPHALHYPQASIRETRHGHAC
jgi:hypothetical protein